MSLGLDYVSLLWFSSFGSLLVCTSLTAEAENEESHYTWIAFCYPWIKAESKSALQNVE